MHLSSTTILANLRRIFLLDTDANEHEVSQHLEDNVDKLVEAQKTIEGQAAIIDEQEEHITDLETRVEALQEENERLTKENEALTAKVTDLEAKLTEQATKLEELAARIEAMEQMDAAPATTGQREAAATSTPIYMLDPMNQKLRRRQ
jgi:predicted RNase H-like nuclease (RuvC/YqgF family)